jgi:hypothetical protein
MKKWIKMVLFLFFLSSSVNICAQSEVKEISIYKTPEVNQDLKGSLRTKIRAVKLNGETNYFLDINEGKVYCTIKYENLEGLIVGIQELEKKAEIDTKNQESDVKSIVMTPGGFVVGYYMSKGKVKRFFGFGDINCKGEDINREFTSYEEEFDGFNLEKETYGTYKSRISDFKKGLEFFSAVKERIEEIKTAEVEL